MIFFRVVKAYGVGDNKASTGEVLKHTENPEERILKEDPMWAKRGLPKGSLPKAKRQRSKAKTALPESKRRYNK